MGVRLEPAGVFRDIPLRPHQLVDDLTPARDCFTLAHHGVAHVDAAEWRLVVDGLAARPCTLSLADLRRFARVELGCFHECAGNPLEPTIAQRRIVNVRWGGVRLADLLASVGVADEARYVWSYGADVGSFADSPVGAYAKDLPLERAMASDVLLADQLNGAPLGPQHGFPVRLLVPGWYGTNSVKWLTRLHLSDRRLDATFTTRFYADPVPGRPGATAPVWAVAPESVIVAPAPGQRLARDVPTQVWGRAWGAREIVAVEVSTDGGGCWQQAELAPRVEYRWQRFALPWRPDRPGPATLLARATDAAGATQPAAGARNAVHAVEVTVGPDPADSRGGGRAR